MTMPDTPPEMVVSHEDLTNWETGNYVGKAAEWKQAADDAVALMESFGPEDKPIEDWTFEETKAAVEQYNAAQDAPEPELSPADAGAGQNPPVETPPDRV